MDSEQKLPIDMSGFKRKAEESKKKNWELMTFETFERYI